MKEKIYKLLNDIKPECDFASSDDFIVEGLLDSLDIVLLISQLEEVFQITIDALDIVPEYFNSVENIVEVVKKSGGM